MRKNIIIIFIFLFSSIFAVSAQEKNRYIVTGTVVDSWTGKGIKNVSVLVLPYQKKINTDVNGKILFNMPEGNYTFIIDEYPFDYFEINLQLRSDTSLIIRLESPDYSRYLEEVEVIATKPATEQPAGIIHIGKQTLNIIPMIAGERDILKAINLSSGVTSSNDGASDLQVRGGVHGQNLFLLDGIPLYSTQHMYGMVSAFNPSIINSATLYKSDFPSEFGGKISSVLDVMSKDADLNRLGGEAEIGIYSTKGMINVPIVKDRLALSLSGRISNFTLLNLLSLMEDTEIKLHFGDINANLTWLISEKDRLKLTFFHNSDGTLIGQKDGNLYTDVFTKNRQQNVGLNWYHKFNHKTENHLLIYGDSYKFEFGTNARSIITDRLNRFSTHSNISSFTLDDKISFDWSDKIRIKGGLSLKRNDFAPYMADYSEEESDKGTNSEKDTQQFEANSFSQLNYLINNKHDIHGGIRVNSSGNSNKVYTFVEPRMGYHGKFKHDFSISASVNRMTQPIYRVANPGVGITMELFLPSDKNIIPETSWVYSLGMAKDLTFGKHFTGIKIEGWYKQMNNILEYRDGYDAMSLLGLRQNIDNFSELVTQGKGKAYGVDISVDYIYKQFSLNGEYTLMYAKSQFDELNNGKWFNSSTDIRHSLSLTGDIKLSHKWSASATWQYRSGRPITLPTSVFRYPDIDYNSDNTIVFNPDHYRDFMTSGGERNSYRTKAFHKLDIMFTKRNKAFKQYDSSFSIGLTNVYNHANPAFYFIGSERNGYETYPVLKSLSMFPILPSFNYMIKF